MIYLPKPDTLVWQTGISSLARKTETSNFSTHNILTGKHSPLNSRHSQIYTRYKEDMDKITQEEAYKSFKYILQVLTQSFHTLHIVWAKPDSLIFLDRTELEKQGARPSCFDRCFSPFVIKQQKYVEEFFMRLHSSSSSSSPLSSSL
jgi:hypothetical protein